MQALQRLYERYVKGWEPLEHEPIPYAPPKFDLGDPAALEYQKCVSMLCNHVCLLVCKCKSCVMSVIPYVL